MGKPELAASARWMGIVHGGEQDGGGHGWVTGGDRSTALLPAPLAKAQISDPKFSPSPKSFSRTKDLLQIGPDPSAMALEWVVLGYATGAEAIMLLLLTLPGLDALRHGMLSVVRSALKPMMSVVPFCLFLLMDIYWKYETRPTCDDDHACTPSEHLRHQKSIMKSQRNGLLILAALLLYWILFSVTSLVVKLDALQHRVDRLKKRDD
ncbi:hypothetical protein ACQ4PT_064486 [Festuca glaucescens]